jgi:stage II sporulation protein P
MDPGKNVCAIGTVITNELENNYGIATIHDTTVNNEVAYTKSYERSGETLDKYLSKYGDFKMVIDIHRDSALDKKSDTMMVNGENIAKFMFVMARKNPHYDKNIALVNSIMNIANKDFPGICNGIYYYDNGTNFFNQGKSNNAFLLEIGSDMNTMDEAKATGKYIARILAEKINK